MEIKKIETYDEATILALYASVGWTAYTDDPVALKKGFENSLLTLGAYENGKLLGLIRVVGDGHTIVLIQDVLVFPEYHRQGIGTKLLKAVLEEYGQMMILPFILMLCAGVLLLVLKKRNQTAA